MLIDRNAHDRLVCPEGAAVEVLAQPKFGHIGREVVVSTMLFSLCLLRPSAGVSSVLHR
jgi:hypothetical protein